MENPVQIEGRAAKTLAVSTAAAQTQPLEGGVYDVSSDVDVFIKVDETANDVTTANGYQIFSGNVISVRVPDGRRIGAIAAAAGTLRYQQTGSL